MKKMNESTTKQVRGGFWPLVGVGVISTGSGNKS